MRQLFFDRIDSVENEFRVAALAVECLLELANENPYELAEDMEVAHVRACADNLERTYIIALFATFEGALRTYWKEGRRRRTWQTVQAKILIEAVASYCHVPQDWETEAHDVREYRNHLAHHGRLHIREGLPLKECHQRLCRFLSLLPHQF